MESGPARRSSGRFSGVRRNVDTVPRLPARAVSRFLRDPRRVPYVVLWTDQETSRIVRVVRLETGDWEEVDPSRPAMVQLRDEAGDIGLELARVAMPLAHGEALLLECFDCEQPRRHLYGGGDGEWLCRRCAGLRYATEGQYVGKRWWRAGAGSPEPWNPWVYSSPQAAAETHGTTIAAEPLLQEWFRLGAAPLRRRPSSVLAVGVADDDDDDDEAAPPLPADPAPVVPLDANTIAMRARMSAAGRAASAGLRAIRPRGGAF